LGDIVLEKNINKPISQKVGLPLSQVRLYLLDMLKALHYCHKIAKVIHRDIKPDNIMVNHNDEAVLIDFGVSAIVEDHEDDTLDTNMGSYMFFAPEMFMRSDKTIKVRGE
jgi:serine/threonine protein kinase